MKWLERIVAGAEYRAGLAAPSSWLVDAFTGPTAASGEKVTRSSAMGLAAVFSAVEKISEAVGSLPLKVYRVVEDNDRVEARTHRSFRMLHDQPNPDTTAHAFWSTVVAQLLLDGNAFLWKARAVETGDVESLYLIDPSSVTIEWDGRVKRFVQESSEGRRAFTSEQVLHIMGFSLDGLIGCSRIAYCRDAIGTALGRARYEGEFYAQGATFPGVIEYPGRLGEQGVKNLAAAMAGKHHGPGQRHKTPVLEEGASFKPVGMSLADMQFVEGAQLSRSDIATMFNLPAAYLNASSGDSLTYATTESNQIQFAQQAIMPLTNRIARALSSDPSILPQNVMYAEFTLEGLLRADMKTRAEYWASMKTTLGLSPEFIASRENIPQSALEEPEPPPPVLSLVPSPEQELAAIEEGRSRARAQRDDHFEELRVLASALSPTIHVDVPPARIEDGAVRVNIEAPPPAPAPVVTVEAPPAANVNIHEGAVQVSAPDVTFVKGSIDARTSITDGAVQVTVPKTGSRTVEFSDGRKATITEEPDGE